MDLDVYNASLAAISEDLNRLEASLHCPPEGVSTAFVVWQDVNESHVNDSVPCAKVRR